MLRRSSSKEVSNKYKLVVESDSMVATSWISKNSGRPWEQWQFFNEIDFLISEIGLIECIRVSRNCNNMADALAKQGVHRVD